MYWGWHHDITLWTNVNSGKKVWEEAETWLPWFSSLSRGGRQKLPWLISKFLILFVPGAAHLVTRFPICKTVKRHTTILGNHMLAPEIPTHAALTYLGFPIKATVVGVAVTLITLELCNSLSQRFNVYCSKLGKAWCLVIVQFNLKPTRR
jgi:hypothetical protein